MIFINLFTYWSKQKLMSKIKIIVKIYALFYLILSFLEMLEKKLSDANYLDILSQIHELELDFRIMEWRDDIIDLEPGLELFTLSDLLLVSKGDFELTHFGLEERDIEFNLSEAHYSFSKLLGNIINIKTLLQNNEYISTELYDYEINTLIFLSKNLKDLTKE